MGDRLDTMVMVRKLGAVPLLGGGSWVPIQHNAAWAEAYLRTKWHLDPYSRVATIDMGRKLGALPPFLETAEIGSISHDVAWIEAYLPTKWHLDPSNHLATTDISRKLAAVPLWGGGPGCPSNTVWPVPRPTCVPSFILIRPTVWPQYTNVTDRTGQTGQTNNGPIA